MIRRASQWLDARPLLAMLLGAAVAFVILVLQRSAT